MLIFYIITAVVLAALIFVFYLIWKEQDVGEDAEKQSEDPVTAAGLLDRLGLETESATKRSHSSIKNGGTTVASFLKSLIQSKKSDVSLPLNPPDQTPPSQQSGTASLRLDNNPTGDDIEKNVELAVKVDELKKTTADLTEKNQKSEQLIAEKNAALEKTIKELEQERKHRKEFNKIKDLLEKELKDVRENAKQIQIELTTSKTENQSYQNRIAQLKEKIQQLETLCTQKDSQITKLSKNDPDLVGGATNEPETTLPNDSMSPDDTQTSTPTDELSKNNREETPLENNIPNDPEMPLPEKVSAAAQSDHSATSSLNLDPVSNLEENYEQDAAPLEKMSFQENPPASETDQESSAGDVVAGADPEQHNNISIEQTNDEEDNDENAPEEKDQQAHLNPDIFKDIEQQFRQIEEELSSTQDNETINTTDDATDDDSEKTKES